MKKTYAVLMGVVLAATSLSGADDPPKNKSAGGNSAPTNAGATAQADDEQAIRARIPVFAEAFSKGDAKAIASSFTDDGEAVDPEGNTIQGRQALEEHYAERFAASPGDKIETTVESIHFVAPGVARETGRTRVIPSDGSTSSGGRFTAIYVKRDGQWLLASIRDLPDEDLSPHDHLKELEWLVGDWVEESEDAVVTTSVKWTDNDNFLLRSFEVRVKGKPAMTGTQRIGWDPLTKQIKSWVFDTSGGYGDGLWMRSGDQWVIKATGVRPDGRIATATQVLTFVNKDTLRWKSIDRTLGSDIREDIDEVVMVRKPPQPR